MGKTVVLFFTTVFVISFAPAFADQGEEAFNSLRCGSCHKTDAGQTNPSLKQIAKGYCGKESQLIGYLKGESDSIISPEKGGMMKRYIEKTKALSDEQRKALVGFILAH
jgi:cytochrome c551/c552